MRGTNAARVFVIEFSDYECPFCARHAAGVAAEIERKFVVTGKVKHAFVNNPLPIHANAKLLAATAICSGEQGRYWEMHDALFASMPKSETEILQVAHREMKGLDLEKLQQCLKSPRPTGIIERDLELVKRLGLSGTPSFAVGRLAPTGHIQIHKFVRGAQSANVFEKVIGAVLEAESQ